MYTENYIAVCEMVGGYKHCNECPLLDECLKNTADFDDRMKKAAAEYLDKLDSLTAILKDTPHINTPNRTDEEWREIAAYLLRKEVAPPLAIIKKEKKA